MSLTELPNQKIDTLDFLSGGGEMGERIRNFDWSRTPLGPPETWEQSLRTVVRIMLTSSQPIWIGWGKELIKLYNDPYKAIVGGKHPDALGKPASFVWKEIWPLIHPMLLQVMTRNEGTYVESQLLIMHRHGYEEEVYYTFSYCPVPGEDGGTAGMICYNTSDTERVINERSLKTLQHLESIAKRQSEVEVYKEAAKAIETNNKDFPFGIIYKIDDANKIARPVAFIGIESDQNVFPSHIELSKSTRDTNNFFKAYNTGEILVSENAGRRKNLPKGFWQVEATHFIHIPIIIPGNESPVAILSAALNPYRKFDNNYKQFAQLIADRIGIEINNVLNYELEKKKVLELAELDEAKTIFFSNISHEFRTPLTLMLGTIEEALNDPTTAPENLERLDVTHRNAIRLLKLVNTLLDFSRIESGRQKATYSLIDIASFTKNLASNFRSTIERAGLKFLVEADNIIQPVYIDKQMWEKIVFNLLSNAFKYTLAGSITLHLYSDKRNVILEVKDTGAGIPEKEIPHMFERFHRAENVTGRTYEGTGIGLSLTKELALLHGGNISVKSKVGKGSTFRVTIPFGKEHLPPDQIAEGIQDIEHSISEIYIEEAASLIENDNKIPGKNKSNDQLTTVLVVDDNADMRQHLHDILQKHFNVDSAANGLDALQKIKAEKPELIISDIMMPVMDGIQLLKEIKDNIYTAQIPVILLTARAGEESRIEGFQTGADDYLVKPFSAKELIARAEAQIKIVKKRNSVEHELYSLFEQAPTAIVIFKGPDAVFELANKRALQIMGKTKEEVIGLKLADALPELKGQGYIDLIKNVFNSGERYVADEAPVSFINDGKKTDTFVRYVFQPLIDENGTIEGVMVLGDDVAMQVIARKKIEESEEKSRIFIEYAPAAMAMFDKEMRYVSVSKQWMKEYDLSGDVVGKKHYELFPNILQRWKDVHSRCMQGSVERSEEDFYVKDDGTPVWLKWEVHPWYTSKGEVGGIVIFTENITERKKAQQDIRESEERFRTMANEAPLFVWVTDDKLQTTYLNNAGLDYFDLDRSMKMSELSWKNIFIPMILKESWR
jgi:PAS domain S-box-containing protein